MMLELGSSVEVLADHMQEGRARPVAHHEDGGHLVRIKSGPKPPDSAFVAAEFSGWWYWIDRAGQ